MPLNYALDIIYKYVLFQIYIYLKHSYILSEEKNELLIPNISRDTPISLYLDPPP
jgi:predicted hydrolase (HD superfamily)